jgi:hypothetical protein
MVPVQPPHAKAKMMALPASAGGDGAMVLGIGGGGNGYDDEEEYDEEGDVVLPHNPMTATPGMLGVGGAGVAFNIGGDFTPHELLGFVPGESAIAVHVPLGSVDALPAALLAAPFPAIPIASAATFPAISLPAIAPTGAHEQHQHEMQALALANAHAQQQQQQQQQQHDMQALALANANAYAYQQQQQQQQQHELQALAIVNANTQAQQQYDAQVLVLTAAALEQHAVNQQQAIAAQAIEAQQAFEAQQHAQLQQQAFEAQQHAQQQQLQQQAMQQQAANQAMQQASAQQQSAHEAQAAMQASMTAQLEAMKLHFQQQLREQAEQMHEQARKHAEQMHEQAQKREIEMQEAMNEQLMHMSRQHERELLQASVVAQPAVVDPVVQSSMSFVLPATSPTTQPAVVPPLLLAPMPAPCAFVPAPCAFMPAPCAVIPPKAIQPMAFPATTFPAKAFPTATPTSHFIGTPPGLFVPPVPPLSGHPFVPKHAPMFVHPTPNPTAQHGKVKEAEEIKVGQWPSVAQFPAWRRNLRRSVVAASGVVDDSALAWIHEVESTSVTFESLGSSGLFPTLDSKLAVAISKISSGEFARRLGNLEELALENGRLVRGRQMLHMMYAEFALTTTGNIAFTLRDLFGLRLAGHDKLPAFLASWDSVVQSSGVIATDEIQTALFLAQVEHVPAMSIDMNAYHRLPESEKTYSWLRKAVDRLLRVKHEKEVRDAQLRALNGSTAPAVPATKASAKANAKASAKAPETAAPAPTVSDRFCYQFQGGDCKRGKDCNYKHVHNAEAKAAYEKYKAEGPKSPRGRSSSPRGKGKGKGKDKERSRSPSPRTDADRAKIKCLFFPRVNARKDPTASFRTQFLVPLPLPCLPLPLLPSDGAGQCRFVMLFRLLFVSLRLMKCALAKTK